MNEKPKMQIGRNGLRRLRQDYTVANASHAETFHFVDDAGHKHELVTRFAFYLIDYLEGRLA